VKACGSGAAEAIAAARTEGGPFTSIFDFCERVDPAQCNRATIEALVKAGAFDALGGHRAACMAVLDRALQSGAAAAADRRSGQKGLFGDDEDDAPEAVANSLPNLPPWSEKEQLSAEKEVLGYYLSSHPLAEFEAKLRMPGFDSSKSLAGKSHRDEITMGGMLAAIKFSHTKNPRPGSTHTKYAMWDLEDLDGITRCIMWPEQFAEYGSQVQADAIIGLRGKIDRRPGAEETNVIVDELVPLADLTERMTSGVVIRVDEQQHGTRGLEQLREILRGYPGTKSVKLRLDLATGDKVLMESNRRIDVTPELRERVEGLLGPGSLSIQAARPKPSSPQNGNGNGFRRREPART
jgi:DNA polymerase-3 subunit alpha